MTDVLSPTPIFKAFTNDGKPLAGGLLYTYAAGTTTPQATYQDSGGTPNANPVVLNFRGECPLWLGSLPYKFLLTDSLGNTIPGYPVDNITAPISSLTGLITDADLDPTSVIYAIDQTYMQTAAELAAGVTPVHYGYVPGDIRRYGGIADSTTDSTTALQNALNASAGFYQVKIIAGTGYYKITARVTAPANTHIVMDEGATLRWTATTANGTPLLGSTTRPGIEATGDNFFIEGKGILQGPTSASYVGNECGLLRIGTSAASRGTGFTVRDVEILNWGAYGCVLQFMERIQVIATQSHNNGYMGYGFLSCQNGRVQRNKIYSITPGTSSNMYGVSCNHDSTNYSSDPNVTAAPRQTVNPFCIDFDVSFNEVYSINWLGLDAHGGYELNYHDNKVYDCYIGIQVASGSGAAANYAGENNKVCNNAIYATQINGNASTTSGHSGQQFGITVNGGSVLSNRAVVVMGNTIVGCGDTSGAGATAYSIQCSLVQDAVIVGNVIRNWYSIGIYGNGFDGTISNNMFNAVANNTLTKCIWADSSLLHSTINGNRLELHGGTAPLEGIRVSNSSSTRPVVSGNEFLAATTPYSGNAATFTAGLSDIPPRLQDATTGSHTVDFSSLGFGPVIYYQYTGAGTATVTSFIGVSVGQVVAVYNSSSSTLTINDTGSTIKLTGGTAAVTQFGGMAFLCVATSGNPSFIEIGRSLTNT